VKFSNLHHAVGSAIGMTGNSALKEAFRESLTDVSSRLLIAGSGSQNLAHVSPKRFVTTRVGHH
jgi:hypothetical protein